ncbi:MAG: 23S rRNA (uracil(1939)-C(5))-methyltransferase RlmD [Clostridiales bacterium]|nr:23S rRNA (uracil(1939)-C(5))-methyltransferase RlmD [Clostridiales bacterium]
MLTKNQLLTTECLRLGSELEGVCDVEGMPLFVPGALPGERVEALVVKAQQRYGFGKLMKVLEPSSVRVEPACPVYHLCGGCSGQHMTYEATLRAKRTQVLDCLNRIGGLGLSEDQVPPVLGAEDPWRFRNKTALPVQGTAKEPQIGFYRRRSHAIVPVEDCPITMGPLGAVLKAVKGWMASAGVQPYNEETSKGLLRHVVVRTSRTGQLMVMLVATRAVLPGMEALIEALKAAEGFCSLVVNVNKARNNVILGRECQVLWGDGVIYETLLGLRFEISPLSFFQVNPPQTERLYQTAIDFAGLTGNELVVDAYAGAGTIALCMAKSASRVIGIEIVEPAVESARRNAERNGITNAEFYAAAVEDLLPRLVADGLRPDVIMLDPPRKGVEPQVIEAVLKAAPRKVVYVSCHVPTQARDLQLLAQGGYVFEACQPVDMFCYAGGVENVVSMVRGDVHR